MSNDESKPSREAKKPTHEGKVDETSLSEEQLKDVSGGLYSSRGLTDTDPCISSLG